MRRQEKSQAALAENLAGDGRPAFLRAAANHSDKRFCHELLNNTNNGWQKGTDFENETTAIRPQEKGLGTSGENMTEML